MDVGCTVMVGKTGSRGAALEGTGDWKEKRDV